MSHIGPLVVVVDIGCGIGRDNEPHREDYNPRRYGPTMPKGLKSTSATVAIGFSVTETAANTFTQGSVDLNLSPLDREVFVVQAINLDGSSPDAIANLNTAVNGSLTTTSQTIVAGLDEANCLARRVQRIRSDATIGVPFSEHALETPPATLEFIGIIATNDFFIQVEGTNCLSAKTMAGKLYGYRAVASADIYAALVQSEVLSA